MGSLRGQLGKTSPAEAAQAEQGTDMQGTEGALSAVDSMSKSMNKCLMMSSVIFEIVHMAVPLCSVFVVIATAAAVNKVKKSNLSWFADDYMAAYLAEEHIPVGISIPNPALVAALWALGVNGVLSKVAAELTVRLNRYVTGKLDAAALAFMFKLSAFFCGFQYLDAVDVSWRVILRYSSDADRHLGVLTLRAITVVVFATVYIIIVGAIQGVKAMKADQIKTGLTRDQVEKAFHDTTVAQAIGVSFTPFFEELFTLAVAFVGYLAPIHTQAWEVAGAFGYVSLVVTPVCVALYAYFVLSEAERNMGQQNAAAAATDDGGGGDDGGGDDGGGGD